MSVSHPAAGAATAPLPRARLAALRAQLLARAQTPPPVDWLVLELGGAAVGWVAPDLADFLVSTMPCFGLRAGRLRLADTGLDPAARSSVLAQAAERMRTAGWLRGWRDELLDIRCAPDAAAYAQIERAACRPLGLTTVAVHLNAFTPDGRLWIARRSRRKAIDPGLWDNLVGGMVPAGESELTALAREALEEAGLDLSGLTVRRGGAVHVTRLVPEGYQSEIVQGFDAVLPAGIHLANRDGEVEAIETRSPIEVVQAIEGGQFTLEAALVTLDGLGAGAEP